MHRRERLTFSETRIQPEGRSDYSKYTESRGFQDQEMGFYETHKLLGTKLIGMNDAGLIHAQPDKKEAIATYGLGGCTGIVIELESSSDAKQKVAFLGHYDPFGLESLHKVHIERSLSNINIEDMTATATIVSPGEYIQDPQTKRYSLQPSTEETEKINKITHFIKDKLGDDTPVQNVAYQTEREAYGSTEQGTIILEYPKDPNQKRIFRVDGIPVALSQKTNSENVVFSS